MSECEVCGGDVVELNKCKECSTLFCNNCGDSVKVLCEYCKEEEEW